MTTFCLALIFLIFSFSNIRAQIASIISEDGDGLIGVTSLMNATINNDLDSVKFFARNDGVKVVNQKNIGGATALHIAARNGNLEIVQALIDNGANVNIIDNEGWTPLARAITSRNNQIVELMIKSGADAGKINVEKESSIIISASSECLECLKTIFSSHDFTTQMNNQILWDQVNRAMEVANKKNDEPMRSLLKEYAAKKLGKFTLTKDRTDENVKKFVIPKVSNDEVITIKSLDENNHPKSNKKFTVNILGTEKATKSYKFTKSKNIVESNVSNVKSPNLIKTTKFTYQQNAQETKQEDYNLSKVIHYKPSLNKGSEINYKNSTNVNYEDNSQHIRYKFLGEKKSYPIKSSKIHY